MPPENSPDQTEQHKPTEKSEKEKRIRALTQMYYSRPEIQKAIFEFSQNRETIPRFFEGFGKRPDTLQYPGDVFQLARKGATSFHCSEEIWGDPLNIKTGMRPKELNALRTGWDLLLDIDSKYLDYSKVLAEIIVSTLKFYGIKNLGVKFSGSKGFHIIVPWKAFPKEINSIKTSEMFPEWPRIITQFIMHNSKNELIEKITNLSKETAGFSKYVRDFEAPKEVIPDLVLVSPRQLFRTPYSLHEKTALASVVLSPEEISNFQPRDASPIKAKIKSFSPDSEEGEASELLREALDWHKSKTLEECTMDSSYDSQKKSTALKGNHSDFKPLNIQNLSEDLIPPAIKKILKGVSDGRKRSVFVLLNFFRALVLERKDIESRLFKWNEKNEVPLKEGYIKTQIDWSYRRSPIMPPNYDKDYYKGLNAAPTDEELRFKNPVNFVRRKIKIHGEKEWRRAKEEKKKERGRKKGKRQSPKDNFKNNIPLEK